MTPVTREDITCKEIIELVTEFLDGALSPDDLSWFEEHIAGCDNCTTYVEQIRLTIAAAGSVTEDSLDPEARDELLAAFRGWNNRTD